MQALKKTKSWKMVSMLIMAVLLLAACSGNTGQTSPSPSATPAAQTDGATPPAESTAPAIDISREVKLKMYSIGDKPKDFDLVYAEINKKLKADINATVEVEFIGWGETATRIPLIFSSGEDYDLIPTANWLGYFNNARNGAYKEMTMEDIQKYAPRTAKRSQQAVFDSAMVDGKLFALPMNYHETTTYGFGVRGDLMDKYGIQAINSLDDLEAYMKAVKENEPDMVPWDNGAGHQFIQEFLTRPYGVFNPDYGWLGIKIDDPKPQLFDILDTPEAIALFKRVQSWNEQGYWDKGALVSKVLDIDSFKSGKSATFFHNMTNANAAYETLKSTHPEWDVRFYPANPDKPYLANPFINNGMAINARTKNYERALMMLDLFKNDESYYRLTFYGIEGTHYDVSDDRKLIPLESNSGFAPGSAFPYPWMDDEFALAPAQGLPNYEQVMSNVNANQKATNIRSFAADRSSLKAIEAAIEEIRQQYLGPLNKGFVRTSVEEDLKDGLKRIYDAGMQQVIDTLQEQLDAFQVVIQ